MKNIILTAKNDKRVEFYTGGTHAAQTKLDMPAPVHELALSPDGKTLYVAATTANQILAFDVGAAGAAQSAKIVHNNLYIGIAGLIFDAYRVADALGIDPDVEVDTYTLEVADGDRLLLCSDGLTSMVRDPDIADIATGSDPSATIVERLVDLALERGGDDNVTVVIIDIDETSDDEPFEAIGASGAKAEHASAVSAPDDVPSAPTVASDLDTPTRKPGRALLWLVATLVPIAVLVVGAWLGLRYWNDHQFYVGVHNGNLALFRGSADSPFGWEPNVVVEATDVRVSRITDEAQRTAIEHGRACKTSDETKARTCFADQRERALNPPAATSP